MTNVIYKDLFDEIIDKLDDFAVRDQPIGEFVRQKKQSPVVVARAATSAMIEFVRQISHVSVPELVQYVELQAEQSYGSLYSFQFPTDSIHERADGGIISFIINKEQVSFRNSVPYEQVVVKSRLPMYDGSENIFNIDIEKRRLYVACVKSAEALIFKRPHSIFAPSQNMFHGVSVELEDPLSVTATVTISDGAGNSVDVSIAAADTAPERVAKFISAINNSDEFLYSAVAMDDNEDAFQMFISPKAPVNIKLNPSIAPEGTGGYVLTDTGTYSLPIPYHFINILASAGFTLLLSEARQEARDSISDQQAAQNQDQGEPQ